MHPNLSRGARALLLAGVLGMVGAASAPAQRSDAPTSVSLPLEWDGIDGDAVRVSFTAEGQLYVRVAGSRPANLLVDRAEVDAFATALRVYVARVQAAGTCDTADPSALPRLAARRVHISGIGGIAIGCDAGAAAGGGARYLLHVTRPSAADGPPLEALPVPLTSAEMRTFVDRFGRMVASRQR